MSKLSPLDYSLRVELVRIVDNLIKKKLFETEKDCLLFVLVKATVIKGEKTGFGENVIENFPKIYANYRQFKKNIIENDIQAEFKILEGQADYDFLIMKG